MSDVRLVLKENTAYKKHALYNLSNCTCSLQISLLPSSRGEDSLVWPKWGCLPNSVLNRVYSPVSMYTACHMFSCVVHFVAVKDKQKETDNKQNSSKFIYVQLLFITFIMHFLYFLMPRVG